ncbi:transposase [Rhizobium tropici]|uniref:Transposase n=1 Tax=Rhizobium tropici TaxID=398 RepID=A0ABR6QZJ4_RHITR|nr:transposase [Rhizobium tropici]MBB5593950.1 transposase [Rhizobium tropici]MBB6492350.1 transposase [Rhizobium tropici]
MARFDLTDFEWSVIEPLLPTKVRGKARVDGNRCSAPTLFSPP